MPHELCGKNCVGGAVEGNVCALEKYIMTEVYNPNAQLRTAVCIEDKSHCLGVSLEGVQVAPSL